MINLNELQSELAALTKRVNSAMELTKGEITFTRDELKQLINKIQEQTCGHMNSEFESAIDGIDVDDYIDLELSEREIEVNFDERRLKWNLKKYIDNKDDITDTDIDKLLKEIKEA
jgi:hypothetical protein